MVDDRDSDRAAILARRRRFVSVALAGLAGVAGTAAATACLKMAAPGPEPAPDDASATDATDEVGATSTGDTAGVERGDDAPERGG